MLFMENTKDENYHNFWLWHHDNYGNDIHLKIHWGNMSNNSPKHYIEFISSYVLLDMCNVISTNVNAKDDFYQCKPRYV